MSKFFSKLAALCAVCLLGFALPLRAVEVTDEVRLVKNKGAYAVNYGWRRSLDVNGKTVTSFGSVSVWRNNAWAPIGAGAQPEALRPGETAKLLFKRDPDKGVDLVFFFENPVAYNRRKYYEVVSHPYKNALFPNIPRLEFSDLLNDNPEMDCRLDYDADFETEPAIVVKGY